jgi:hypothetical protein
MESLFKIPDTWFGGSYDLAMEYKSGSDEVVREALRAAWASPNLDGCYLKNDAEIEAQQKVKIDDQPLGGIPLYGLAELPGGKRVPCFSHVVQEEGGRADWINVGLPLGALERIYPVWSDDTWCIELDEWLVKLSHTIYDASPFRLGLVGWIIGGIIYAEDIKKTGLPAERFFTYLLPGQEGLEAHSRNAGGCGDGP